MKEKYFVVSMDDDGEWSFSEYKTMDEVYHEYGLDDPEDDYVKGEHPAYEFKKSIDESKPGNVLIKGKVLMPRPKEVVKAWDFEEEE